MSQVSSNNKKRKILFVDDEPDMTSLFRLSLKRAGFDIDTFNDPLLALESFKPNKYDLLLLDIAMPKMDGFELYEQLRKMDPDVKICFITAAEKYCEDLRVEENQTLSKDLFIQKPLSIRDLVRKIDERINSGSGSD
jgi:DNA-binding response OmpR family regulator